MSTLKLQLSSGQYIEIQHNGAYAIYTDSDYSIYANYTNASNVLTNSIAILPTIGGQVNVIDVIALTVSEFSETFIEQQIQQHFPYFLIGDNITVVSSAIVNNTSILQLSNGLSLQVLQSGYYVDLNEPSKHGFITDIGNVAGINGLPVQTVNTYMINSSNILAITIIASCQQSVPRVYIKGFPLTSLVTNNLQLTLNLLGFYFLVTTSGSYQLYNYNNVFVSGINGMVNDGKLLQIGTITQSILSAELQSFVLSNYPGFFALVAGTPNLLLPSINMINNIVGYFNTKQFQLKLPLQQYNTCYINFLGQYAGQPLVQNKNYIYSDGYKMLPSATLTDNICITLSSLSHPAGYQIYQLYQQEQETSPLYFYDIYTYLWFTGNSSFFGASTVPIQIQSVLKNMNYIDLSNSQNQMLTNVLADINLISLAIIDYDPTGAAVANISTI